ncbi:MAG: class II glutamine amidotransferase [Promethearchaeota archaeon]
MCRMFFQCAKQPFTISIDFLKKFVSSCHWQYLRKYNLFGHHNLGWGFAFISQDEERLIIKRDITPIYQANWKGLNQIKTRFLLVHARKAYPWNKNFKNIHPINIGENYQIVHNGVIKTDSFLQLNNAKLEKIRNETTLDTRRYLCSIIDKLKNGIDLKKSLEEIFKTIEIGAGANAFLFNTKECNVITHHNNNFNGQHHTLFIKKSMDNINVCTTPIINDALEIPNNSLIQIDLKNFAMKFNQLDI